MCNHIVNRRICRHALIADRGYPLFKACGQILFVIPVQRLILQIFETRVGMRMNKPRQDYKPVQVDFLYIFIYCLVAGIMLCNTAESAVYNFYRYIMYWCPPGSID
ncbi:hypothetical protein D3C74_417900 [compost metagenome]